MPELRGLPLSELLVWEGGIVISILDDIRQAGAASESQLTHIDAAGNARMVDVSEKPVTARRAVATGEISMSQDCLNAIIAGNVKKGDVLSCARIAGIMAAKRTSELIPLCHGLNVTSCEVDITPCEAPPSVSATCTVAVDGKTGVEMEALTGVSVALLTVYDMCKALDRAMEIGGIRLLRKAGGRSGEYFGGD